MTDNPFRNVPSVNDVLAAPAVLGLLCEHSHAQLRPLPA